MKKPIRHFFSLIILTGLTAALLTPSVACLAANITDQMKGPLANVALPAGDDEGKVLSLIGGIIGIFLSLLGIIFLVLIIYGGYKWMMARGAEDEVTAAKTIIRNAVIGLVIVMAAYAISYFVATALEKTLQ